MNLIKPLTSLRFFAAMMVLASHYWGFAPGYSGVTFFYVLSGYVLAINYAAKVSTPADRRSFWWKRFARIYPTHLLTLLIAAPLGGSLLVAVPNLLLLQSWVPSTPIYFGFNGPAWSISDEAFFYALFPFLILALRSSPWPKLAIWSAASVAAATMWWVAFPTWTNESGSIALSIAGKPLTAPLTHFVFYIFPPARLVEFALGIGLATATARRSFSTGAEIAACLFAVASVSLFYVDLPFSLAASSIFVPAAMVLVYVFSRSSGALSKLLSARPLVLLGNASFMLYMLHWPLLMYNWAPTWILAPVVIALSILFHLGFEKPVQHWLLALRSRTSGHSVAPIEG